MCIILKLYANPHEISIKINPGGGGGGGPIYRISLVIRQFFIFIPKQPQNLDPSFKMDLDLWDCLGRVKLVL